MPRDFSSRANTMKRNRTSKKLYCVSSWFNSFIIFRTCAWKSNPIFQKLSWIWKSEKKSCWNPRVEKVNGRIWLYAEICKIIPYSQEAYVTFTYHGLDMNTECDWIETSFLALLEEVLLRKHFSNFHLFQTLLVKTFMNIRCKVITTFNCHKFDGSCV